MRASEEDLSDQDLGHHRLGTALSIKLVAIQMAEDFIVERCGVMVGGPTLCTGSWNLNISVRGDQKSIAI
jgi:hypothetical protein